MKIAAKSFTQLVFGTVAGISVLSLLLPQITWAQTADVSPSQDVELQQSNDFLSGAQNSDPFAGNSEQDSFGVFDLIHRATLGSNRSQDEYSTEQNQNIDTAAAQFRALQRQRISGQKATPANPAAPQSAN